MTESGSGNGNVDGTGGGVDRHVSWLFGDDFPDERKELARIRERRAVQRQVERLSLPRRKDIELSQLINQLRNRRNQRADDPTVTRFDVVPRTTGPDILVVSGEILVRRDALDGPGGDAVRRQLENAGFRLAAEGQDRQRLCPELDEKVVRFTAGSIDPLELAEFGRSLRAQGISASVNHVTPLAPVVKGKDGPEPSEARPRFTRTEPIDTGVTVAIIDTGIAEERRTDGWLQYDDIDRQKNGDNIDETDKFWGPNTKPGPTGGDGFLDAASGHGTFVTGIVQRISPRADIRVYRAVDSDGIGGELTVGCAMIRAVKDGANILNLSLGSQTIDDGPPIGLEAALEVIHDIEGETGREVLVIAAAGNDGDTRPCWPAAFRRVVSVAALDAGGSPAIDWSTHGPWVDCSTIGVGITSTYLPGVESPDLDEAPDTFRTDSWAVWTGTSFAAPQITGAVARLGVEAGLSPRKALAALLARGVEVPDFGRAVKILPGT